MIARIGRTKNRRTTIDVAMKIARTASRERSGTRLICIRVLGRESQRRGVPRPRLYTIRKERCHRAGLGGVSYNRILADADAFFRRVMESQPQHLQCGRGCSLCCYGLFEIGSGDVPVIAEGLEQMHPMRRKKIIRRALELSAPNLRELAAEEKEAFFERAQSTPCPLLDESGACTMYEHRPLVCRTFGLPLREGRKYIGDICELNFKSSMYLRPSR